MDTAQPVISDNNKSEPQCGECLEPYVGMAFESEDAAKEYYMDYARRLGFVVRIMYTRRSEIDGKILARRLGCNKEGFSPNQQAKSSPNKKPRPSSREGCQATLSVKLEKSGKWVVSKFVKDHTHRLVSNEHEITAPCNSKDKKIEELTRQIQHQDELCIVYRRRLLHFLEAVGDQSKHLSSKIQDAVDNVLKLEAELRNSFSSRFGTP